MTGELSVPTRLSDTTDNDVGDVPFGIAHEVVDPDTTIVIHAVSVRSRMAYCHGTALPVVRSSSRVPVGVSFRRTVGSGGAAALSHGVAGTSAGVAYGPTSRVSFMPA